MAKKTKSNRKKLNNKNNSKLSVFFLVLAIISFLAAGTIFGLNAYKSHASKVEDDATAKQAIDIIDSYTNDSAIKVLDKKKLGEKIVEGLHQTYGNDRVTGLLEGGPLISPYPIIGTKSIDDENYWLRRDLQGNWTWDGTLFTDFKADPNFDNWNTTIFGHRMKNLHMFGTFRYFENQEEYDNLVEEGKDVFTLSSAQGKKKYKVASVIMTQLYDRTFFRVDKDKQWLKDNLEKSVVNTNINKDEVLNAKSFITLVTCTNESGPNRTILLCYQVD